MKLTSVHDNHVDSSIEMTGKKMETRKKKEKNKKHVANCVINDHKEMNGVCNVQSIKETDKRNNVMEIDINSLKESIKSESVFIKKLINTIHKEIYSKSNNLEKISEEMDAYEEDKLEGIGLKRKADKLSKSTRNKRAKLDPEQQKVETEFQEGLATPKELILPKPPSNNHHYGIETLRQRLQVKIASLRGARQSLKSSDIVEKKRLKKQIKALKKKNKNQQSKRLQPTLNTPIRTEKTTNTILPPKPVYNKEGKMVFSKFDFSENGNHDNKSKKKKNSYDGKDYKSLLNKVERDKEKFAKLKETDETKAKLVQEKNLWKNVIDKAEGLKVKKDEDLLKKALKKKEYRKKKSKKGWDMREGMMKQRKEEKAKKREKHIKARKEDKMKQKIKKGAKRGRLLPHTLS